MTWKLFGRDPAMYLQLFAALVMCAGLVWHFTIDQQSLLNAGALAVVGVIGAFVLHDGQSMAILNGIKALVSLVIGFGLHISADWQTAIMMVAAAVTAMYVRTQATAPVPTPVPIALLKKAPTAIAALVLSMFLFNGCTTTQKEQGVVASEKIYTTAFYTMDTFIHLEKSSRDQGLLPDPNHKIKHVADAARIHGREYVKTVEDATDAYNKSATDTNKNVLDNAISVLNSLLSDIDNYFPQLQAAVNKQKGTDNGSLFRPVEGYFVYRYERTHGGRIHWQSGRIVEARASNERRGESAVSRGRGTDENRPGLGG